MRARRFRSLDRTSSEVCDEIGFNTDHPESVPLPASIRGGGNSLVGAFFGKNTTVVTPFSGTSHIRIDPTRKSINVCASTRIFSIYNVLVPHGYSLKALPSYPSVTVGGCIAANVHGQNSHREGYFEENILALTLFHPEYGTLSVSRTKHPELFFLTIGGLGLTGIILRAELAITKIPSNLLWVTSKKYSTLQEAYEILVEEKDEFDYFHCSSHWLRIESNEEPGSVKLAKFCSSQHRVNDSISDMGRFSTDNPALPKTPLTKPMISLAHKVDSWRSSRSLRTPVRLSKFLFPSHKRIAYFSMFGNRGLIEHQILVPHGAVPDYLKDIAKILKQYKPLIPLYHLKLFSGDRRSINFSGTGLSLALHFAADEKALKSLTEIDRVNISFGCITNLIKDSRVSRETIYEQYKHLDEFRTQLEAFSPNRTFQNLISQRLF